MYKVIGADGREYGPVSPEQLRQWITEGRANAQTRVQAEGETAWKTLTSLPELAAALPWFMNPSLKFVGILALMTTGFATLFFFDPARTGLYPPCPFHWLTGLNCPGCGSLRALHQLAHGHLLAALRLNPLTVLILPLSCALLVKRGQVFVKPVWIWTLLGIIIAFGVLRNIPLYPFTLLTAKS